MRQAKRPIDFEPASPPSLPQSTFQNALDFIDGHPDWVEKTRRELKTALRQIARSIALADTRQNGWQLNPDCKALDLAAIAFDIPTINRALAGVSYGLAGFATDKSYRNAKSALRRVGRVMGMLAPMMAPKLPPDGPYAPFLAQTTVWTESAARLFAARQSQQNRLPQDVTAAVLMEHGTFLRTALIGVKVEVTLRRIVKLWHQTAAHNPDWPQTPLTLPTQPRLISPPLSLYPASLQQEIETVRRWMEGANQTGPFGAHMSRKPFRPDTVAFRLKYIRLMLGVLVALGRKPASLNSLQCLLVPETMQAILQALWDRGQQRRAAMPEHHRSDTRNGSTGQTHAAGLTLLMLATHCFPQPAAVLKQLQRLAKAVRLPKQSQISRKNRHRLDQFDDPDTHRKLLSLPQRLMEEAVTLRQTSLNPALPVHEAAAQQRAAARLARAALLLAIEIRIPLRIKNLQSCRLGHNLRFAGAKSQMVTLGFQAYETKNWLEVEFFVGARLCNLLSLYIRDFLPVLAAGTSDFATMQWLFPAGDGGAGPLSINQVRKIITDTMAERIGVVFHPHLFRGLAVKTCLQHSPNGLEQCRQLLGDKTLDVILKHYAPVQQREAAAYLDRLVSAEEDRLGAAPRPTKRSSRRGDVA